MLPKRLINQMTDRELQHQIDRLFETKKIINQELNQIGTEILKRDYWFKVISK